MKLLGDAIRLGNDELVSQELMYCHLTLLLNTCLLGTTELLREDDVVTNLLADWLLDLVAFELQQLVLDNIILLEFVPIFFSLIE